MISFPEPLVRRAPARRLFVRNKLTEANAKATSLQSFRSTFDRTITLPRWTLVNGLRFFLQWYYARSAIYWLPRGWVPGYVEWALAFPRAPRGSVSVQVWGIACATVVQLVGQAAVGVWGLVVWVWEG